MARSTMEQHHVRKLGALGSSSKSYYVTLPIELIRLFDWREGQKLVVRKGPGKSLVIKDSK